MPKAIFLFSLFFLYIACSRHENEVLPEHIKKLGKLTVYPADTEPELDIRLVREQSFGSTDEVLIGSIGDMAVDESGRVFISDKIRQTTNVFADDGRYLTQLGRKGKGPAEFRNIFSLKVIENQLYVTDNIQQQCTIFSLDTLAYSHTVRLHPENQDSYEELTGLNPAQYFIKSNGTFLVRFQPMLVPLPDHPRYNLNDITIRYYTMSPGGIISDNVLEQDGTQYLTATINGEFEWSYNFLFTDKPLIAISDDNRLFSARREEFLIKIHGPDGEYLYAFYYPYQRMRLTRGDALSSSTDNAYRKNVIRHADLPETWPALNEMLIDDKNRLWVSTIVENFEVYEWWVLKATGELLARFTWPREKNIEEIKNGNLYARETDEETGLQQIVRYRIEMN